MPLISHRGAAHLADANTYEAILAGDSYRPDFVEVDINCTADKQLVIFHGSATRFLNRKHMKESYIELKNKFPSLIRLEEFTKLEIKSAYMFDVKIADEESLDRVINELNKMNRRDFSFTSPHEQALVMLKNAFSESIVFQSQPYHHGPVVALEIARKNNFDGVSLNKWWMTPLVHRLCKAHGKKMMCYTIDSRIGIKLIHRFFPDVYITTNRPDVYRSLYPEG